MSFNCPRCSTIGSLQITNRIELPPDARSDEITVQTVMCSFCGFRAVAVYEESRRGALDKESWSHIGYLLENDVIKILEETIDSCPQPSNWRCTCSTHKSLGRADRSGRWNGIPELDTKTSFSMQLTK